jgi:ribosomal protein S18 acetylase RimI-like enzyme
VNVDVRPLMEADLAAADRIFRQAFGTFLGLADPLSFAGDADMVCTRWRADPEAALGAYIDGELVGSNFLSHWGSFGFFGPLTVRPDLWDRGIARRLLDGAMAGFRQRRVEQVALFTFPHSPKHIGLYQSYDFWPQQLTAVMSRSPGQEAREVDVRLLSSLAADQQTRRIGQCAELTHRILPGLDLGREMQSLAAQNLGETVLLENEGVLRGFALCHMGPGTEAGSDCLYVKFAAVSPGADAPRDFNQLLAACEALAVCRGLGRVVAGVNTARHGAYRALIERGYRALVQGVSMQLGNRPGYNREECFVIDDWR